MSDRINALEKKIIELETRVTKLEKLDLLPPVSTNLSGFPKEIISNLDKISSKNLVLIGLKIQSSQSIDELKTNLLKIGWIEDTFFKKNFSTVLVSKGLVRKVEDDAGNKGCFSLTERGIIVADELFIKLTKK